MSVSDTEVSGDAVQRPVWTFERFTVGEHIGTSFQRVDQETLDCWNNLYKYSGGSGLLPHGIAQLVVMRAYAEVVIPRPDGNIHFAQRVGLVTVPSIDSELSAKVHCLDKYMRKKRRMIEFRVTVSDIQSGTQLCDATLTICWAK